MEQFLIILICTATLGLAIHLYRKGRQQKVNARVWTFGIIAWIMVPFGLAWCVTSYEEGEPFAGIMGVLVFSGLGVVSALLAQNQYRKAHPSAQKNLSSKTPTPIGWAVVAIVLTLLGAVLLPYSVATNRLITRFNSPEKFHQQVADKVLSDDAITPFIGKTLAYETLHGIYPAVLEERLMQAMISGVKEEEMIALLDKVLPESDRLALLDKATTAGVTWLGNDTTYPDLTIELAPILGRAPDNAEFILGWLYKNFAFPPMDSTAVANVMAGDFSAEMAAYMTTPPDSLRPIMITYGAKALQNELSKVEIPTQIVLASEMQGSLPAEQVPGIKSNVKTAGSVMKILWILPVLILVTAFAFVIWKLPNKIQWAGVQLLMTSVIGMLLAAPLRDIPTTIFNLTNDLGGLAPAPALALIDLVASEVFTITRGVLIPLYKTLLVFAVGLLLMTYANQILRVTKQFFGKRNTENVVAEP